MQNMQSVSKMRASGASLRSLTCSKQRKLVTFALSRFQYSSAQFHGLILVSMSNYAKAVYGLGQYKRAVSLLRKHEMLNTSDKSNMIYIHFAAQCMVLDKMWFECITLLSEVLESLETVKETATEYHHIVGEEINTLALCCLLMAKAYDGSGNRYSAISWLKITLAIDPYCFEAFEQLNTYHMLGESEERELLDSVKAAFKDGSTENMDTGDWLHQIYVASTGVYSTDKPVKDRFDDLENRWGLRDNVALMNIKANILYHQNDVESSYKITSTIRSLDPYMFGCLALNIASMVRLKLSYELHYHAHKLVQDYPQQAVSWFAVGCYYMVAEKYDVARQYFIKSKSIDGNFAPAWIGIGNAFAKQDESDQSMSVYRCVSRLFPGSHLPFLSIGMEYMRTNNFSLATEAFNQAISRNKSDPLLFNELGVQSYKDEDYNTAIEYYRTALGLKPVTLEGQSSLELWECIHNNLGHAYRKAKLFNDAITQFQLALKLVPNNASTLAGLGYTHHVRGNDTHRDLDECISLYNKALGINPDDTFTEEMLSQALIESFNKPLILHRKSYSKEKKSRKWKSEEHPLSDIEMD